MFNEVAYVVVLLLVLPYIESVTNKQRLSEYISHHETLDYDTDTVHAQHSRSKRSTDAQGPHVQVKFKAHGRHFHLRLRRDTSAFSENLKVDGAEGPIPDADVSHIYQGELADEPGSVVFGSITDGVFDGKIVTKDGSFYVEHARRYIPKNTTKRPSDNFHSVIYRDGDVGDPYAHKRDDSRGGCGITEEVIQWMERIQNSAVEEEGPSSSPGPAKMPPPHPNGLYDDDYSRYMHGFNKYSRSANIEHHRMKRAASRIRDDNKNTCSLYIQTDPLLWRHIREGFPDHRDKSKKQEIDIKTREEILALIAQHVTAVTYLYKETKFDGRSQHRNIKFEVQRIKIDDDSSCNPRRYGAEINQFCLENIDVSNFLNLHSLGNHEDFCLAYVFTYRDFTGGTLGLAWVASASGASGGICEKYKTYTETIGGMYQSTKRSLNTGIITFVNYNSRVPPKVSQLTLAHEIGHNFGSPHDFPVECRPGGHDGNYIMFASATSGDRPNNSKFSMCSVANISAVLDSVRDGRKRNCLTSSAGAFCGNKIVEDGEECDCGYDESECNDKCCYPRVVSQADRERNESAKGCHRRANTQCSPSQGPCCSSTTCSFVTGGVCRPEAECAHSAHCAGISAQCPVSPSRPKNTPCNNGTQICRNGECSGSICLAWNMSKCFLSSTVSRGDGVRAVVDPRGLCQLACQSGEDASTCRSTAEFAREFGLPEGGVSLPPGSPCDNYQGYCDVFLKCRPVDAEGPLVRLKKLLLDNKTLDSLKIWLTEHWWGVMLSGVGFILVFGVFIKCCAVHTPSSNPKRAPARRFTETLRRPVHTLRRMNQRHARPSRSSRPYSGAYPTRGSHAPRHSHAADAPRHSRANAPYSPQNAIEMRATHKV